MPLKHKENVLTTIEDIQRLASKDLKNILRENAVAQGGNIPFYDTGTPISWKFKKKRKRKEILDLSCFLCVFIECDSSEDLLF